MELSVKRLAKQFWKVANRTVRNRNRVSVVYFSWSLIFRPEHHSAIWTTFIQTKSWVLYACSLQFNLPEAYKVSQSLYKTFVFLSVKRIWKTLGTCQKKTTVINVFILNNLDFQNCFLSIFNFKAMYECEKLIWILRSFEVVHASSSKSSSALKSFGSVSSAWAFCREFKQDASLASELSGYFS